jgi:transglutaminase-like putative cysteine protease
MIARRLGLLPVLVAVTLLGKSADDWQLAATLAAIATVLALIGPRWELDRGRQLVTSAMGAGAGYALVPVLYDPQPGGLGEGWTRFAAAVILAAAARFPVVRPDGGRMTTTALVFAGVLAAGETRVGGYAIFVVLFLLTSLLGPVTSDDDSTLSEVNGRRVAVGTAICVVSGAVAIGVTIGLRAAYAWITRGDHSTALIWTPRVGFSDRMDLGALDGLLDSDTVVLRVRGPRVDYLRGAALDFYAAGQWLRSERSEVESEATYDGDLPGAGGVEIAAVSERTDRFFLPLDAHDIVTSPTMVLVDGVGAIKREAKHGFDVTHFVAGGRDRAAPAPPGPSDLQLPRGIRSQLAALAVEWTRGAPGTPEKLEAIEHRLRTGYRYARAFQRVGGTDPAIDFLLGDKSGHCEYFATGMALVARAAGIPARMVMGYRVGEQSPFGYYVVRERNAHAWVEAWVPGQGWTTHDPTPESDLPQNQEHQAGYAASAADALRVAYDELTDWLRRRTLQQTAIAWGLGFIVLIWIVARGARRRIGRIRRTPDDEAALPCLAILLSSLEKTGLPHPEHEPIERLAVRVRDPRAAQLLERYAALRYGGLGSAAALAEDIESYARAPDRPATSIPGEEREGSSAK